MPSCKLAFAQLHRSANTQDTVALTHNMPSLWQKFSQHVVALTQHCTTRYCANVQHTVALTHAITLKHNMQSRLPRLALTHDKPLLLHNTPLHKHSIAQHAVVLTKLFTTRCRTYTHHAVTLTQFYTTHRRAYAILHNMSCNTLWCKHTTRRWANTTMHNAPSHQHNFA